MASLPFPAVCCGISVRIGQCPPQPPLGCSVAGSPIGYQCVRRHSQVWVERYSCVFGRWRSRVHMTWQSTTIFALPKLDIRNGVVCVARPCCEITV